MVPSLPRWPLRNPISEEPSLAMTSCGAVSDVHCAMVLAGTHLERKNACSVGVRRAQVKSFSRVPDVPSKVQITRESVLVETLVSSCWSASHWCGPSTSPVAGSMVCEKTLPDQVLVSYVVLKIWLSVCVTFGLEVADA